MDNKRFDNLTRGIAQGVSRRDALKLFVAAIAGIGASSILKLDGEELSTGTQTAAAKIACQRTNDVSLPCEQYYDYIADCSTICPHGERGFKTIDNDVIGFEGCTVSDWDFEDFSPPQVPSIIAGGIPKHDKANKQWCIEATIAWPIYWIQPPVSDIVRFRPSEVSCCGPECNQEIFKHWAQIEEHEKGHRDIMQAEFDKVKEEWSEKRFGYTPKDKICGKKNEVEYLFGEAVRQAQFKSRTAYKQAVDVEPPFPETLNCNLCREAGNNEVCCFGQCQNINTCQPCAKPCGDTCCGPCEECTDPSLSICRPKTCSDCTQCNPTTDACELVDCGDPCLVCQNNSCQPKCVGCMHCQDGICISGCGENESCCGDQCFNGSQGTCCGPENARYLCPPNTECCAGSQSCCDTRVSRCCGGVCVPYGISNCGDCRPCNPGQVCCIGPQGQIYGCDDAVNCPR